jgi:hypothetical protein
LSYEGMVSAAGLEPSDPQLVVLALSLLSYADVAAMTGLEPAASTLTGWHSYQLSYITIGADTSGAAGAEPAAALSRLGRGRRLLRLVSNQRPSG